VPGASGHRGRVFSPILPRRRNHNNPQMLQLTALNMPGMTAFLAILFSQSGRGMSWFYPFFGAIRGGRCSPALGTIASTRILTSIPISFIHSFKIFIWRLFRVLRRVALSSAIVKEECFEGGEFNQGSERRFNGRPFQMEGPTMKQAGRRLIEVWARGNKSSPVPKSEEFDGQVTVRCSLYTLYMNSPTSSRNRTVRPTIVYFSVDVYY
jgi:hypothetical protein